MRRTGNDSGDYFFIPNQNGFLAPKLQSVKRLLDIFCKFRGGHDGHKCSPIGNSYSGQTQSTGNGFVVGVLTAFLLEFLIIRPEKGTG
jgi:hypothetical protein